VLPFIKAEKLQNLIWYQLFAKLSLRTRRKKSDIEKVVDLKRYDRQIKELERKIDSLKTDLKRKQTAQKRIYGLLEEDGYTKEDFLKKLRETDDKITNLKDYLAETEAKIESVKAAKANDKVLRDFLNNKGELINRFYQDLTALSAEDKKRLVESMLSEKIRLVKEHEGDDGWANLPYQFSFNPLILEEFMQQDKIVKLNTDGMEHHESRILCS
jgi:chromosome segregation ATPase